MGVQTREAGLNGPGVRVNTRVDFRGGLEQLYRLEKAK